MVWEWGDWVEHRPFTLLVVKTKGNEMAGKHSWDADNGIEGELQSALGEGSFSCERHCEEGFVVGGCLIE